MTEEISSRHARQGRNGYRIVTVLVISLVLAVAAYGLLEFLW